VWVCGRAKGIVGVPLECRACAQIMVNGIVIARLDRNQEATLELGIAAPSANGPVTPSNSTVAVLDILVEGYARRNTGLEFDFKGLPSTIVLLNGAPLSLSLSLNQAWQPSCACHVFHCSHARPCWRPWLSCMRSDTLLWLVVCARTMFPSHFLPSPCRRLRRCLTQARCTPARSSSSRPALTPACPRSSLALRYTRAG